MDTRTQQTPATQPVSPTPSPAAAAGPATQSASRWFYLDWLRVLAILTVFLYHVAKLFDIESPTIPGIGQQDQGMTLLARALELWGMPLFFVVAAIAMYFSLGTRDNRRFISERFKRLIIPYVLGVLLLGPPLVYGQRMAEGQFSGSFWQFLPHYFEGWYGFGGNFAWTGIHLWFLLMLFLYSLLLLPLFRYLRRTPRVAGALKRFPTLQGELFLVVPIACTAIIELLVNPYPDSWGARIFGGWSVFAYVGFFLGGYLLALNPQAITSFERNRMWTLLAGVGLTVVYLILVFGYDNSSYTLPFSLLRAINAWLWFAAILGYAKRYLNVGTRWLAEANQAVLPFYILHVPVLIVVAMVILPWRLPVLFEFVVIALVAFAIIVGLIEGIVRHVPLLRVAFGMKAK